MEQLSPCTTTTEAHTPRALQQGKPPHWEAPSAITRESLHSQCSVQFSRSVVSDSLRPQGLQCTRPPYQSPTPRVYSNSCPLSWRSNHLILCCPLFPPSIFPSIRVFSSESVLCIRWPKYWSFSFSISPPNGYSDWFPLGWTGWIITHPV